MIISETVTPGQTWQQSPHNGKKHGNIIGIYETTYGISSWKNQRTTLWLFNMAMENGPFYMVYLLKMVIFHGYVK